jgi:hypothetical protein
MKDNKILITLFILVLLFSMFGVPPSVFKIERNGLIGFFSENNLIFKAISIFLIFLHALIYSNLKNQILKINKYQIFYSLFFFKCYVLLKYLFQIQMTFGILEIWLFINIIYSYLHISDKLNIREIYYAFHIASWIFIVINALQYISDPNALFISQRFISITGNSNHAAVLLSLLILLNSISLSLGYFKKPNVIVLFILTPMLIFTGSKTGLIVLIPFIIWNAYASQNKIKYILLFSLLVASSSYFENNYLLLKTDNIFSRSLKFEDTRTIKWSKSLTVFSDNPFFGDYKLNQRPQYVENSYLACLENYGFLGFLIFLYFLKQIYNFFDFGESLHVDLLFLAIIGIFIGAFFEAYLLSNTNLVLHTILSLIILKKKENDNNTGYFFNR